MSADTTSSILNRLPWFVELVDYLKTHEDDLWGWFSTEVDQEKQAEAVRLELLRTTYRIERESQVELYESADAVAATVAQAAANRIILKKVASNRILLSNQTDR